MLGPWLTRPYRSGITREGRGESKPYLRLNMPLILLKGHPEVPRLSALEESSDALNEALHALSQRLSMLTNNASTIEPASISSTAEAMSKVLEALSRAKALTENTIS